MADLGTVAKGLANVSQAVIFTAGREAEQMIPHRLAAIEDFSQWVDEHQVLLRPYQIVPGCQVSQAVDRLR